MPACGSKSDIIPTSKIMMAMYLMKNALTAFMLSACRYHFLPLKSRIYVYNPQLSDFSKISLRILIIPNRKFFINFDEIALTITSNSCILPPPRNLFCWAQQPNHIQIMKKIAFIAAAALCSSFAIAQDAPVTATEQPIAATCSPEDAEALVDEVIASLTEVVEVLESIQDKASADAAVAKLDAVRVRMEAAQAKMDALGQPDEATQEKLAIKLLPALFNLSPRLEAAGQRISDNDCYGSDALKSAMEGL